jgi:3-deoxy-D-manno-octulosonic acid (KDO) 8-phosphate synthase
MKLCGFEAGADQPFFLIAGTCVIESEQMALDTAPWVCPSFINHRLTKPIAHPERRFVASAWRRA